MIDEKHAELTRRRGEYDTLTGRITQLIAEVGRHAHSLANRSSNCSNAWRN